jgi:hypothetical protein
MAKIFHSVTLSPDTDSMRVQDYTEFDGEEDGRIVAETILERFGSKQDAFDECLLMLIIASPKNDMTTITGCLAALRYMRKNGWDKP